MLFSYTHVLSFSTWCLHQVYIIKRKSDTVDEVVDVIFAGDDSADEYMQSESSESESESYESEEPVATPEPIRGNVVRRSPRTRGDRSQSILSWAQIREVEIRKLRERWKRQDNPPVIPVFFLSKHSLQFTNYYYHLLYIY